MYTTLQLDHHENGIAVLAVNRPDKLNALNAIVMSELDAAFENFSVDQQIKAVILTGAGDKAFVAGADIAELSSLDGPGGRELSERGQAVFNRIARCPKPVVAVLEGYALGGGCELAMAAHLRIAGVNAVLGLPEVSLGLIPGYGGTQRLARLVGHGRALEMILTGNPIQAEHALQIGLVNRVVDHGKALDEALAMLHTLLKRAPLALAAAIKAVTAGYETPEEGYATEADLFGQLCTSADFKEGTRAFLAKEKPDYKGK